MTSYDVLIAGAGPAGCAAAYDLARAGKRVLLLDKRTFPRHKACACGLTRKTLKALRYSVEPIVERVCHEIVLQQAASNASQRALRVRTRNPICAMAVRERFDDFCLQQTLAAGADLRKIEGIVSIRETGSLREAAYLHAGTNGVEIDIATAAGIETLSAPFMIGADGSNGQTRRLAEGLRTSGEATAAALPADPQWYARAFALEATVPYAALPATLPGGDSPHDLVFDFAPLPGGYGWLFPKGDHINIGVGAFAPADEAQLKSATRTLLAEYAQAKLGVATLTDSGLAKITGQYLGMGGFAYVPRGRVLLAGDAAGLVDSLTGEGIHSAIVSGQAAATAILASMDTGRRANVAEEYAKRLRPLQETLAFSHRAAQAFYKQPARGFRVMRIPLLRSLVLKTYSDGLQSAKLLGVLAKIVA
ncbi:geranylgeranyl reductase family protein [Granulicella sp. S156]|jgi:geranylgeranyl reductase family protein|uniref:geranylgeranyl reductase family protein n=1 Tax=Granulicella sp. S156 TaxID=1747224 RepID=UPI00131AA9ED|nr:geranylgeranyl reductase family protein [Granulicella sp. S156]